MFLYKSIAGVLVYLNVLRGVFVSGTDVRKEVTARSRVCNVGLVTL